MYVHSIQYVHIYVSTLFTGYLIVCKCISRSTDKAKACAFGDRRFLQFFIEHTHWGYTCMHKHVRLKVSDESGSFSLKEYACVVCICARVYCRAHNSFHVSCNSVSISTSNLSNQVATPHWLSQRTNNNKIGRKRIKQNKTNF